MNVGQLTIENTELVLKFLTYIIDLHIEEKNIPGNIDDGYIQLFTNGHEFSRYIDVINKEKPEKREATLIKITNKQKAPKTFFPYNYIKNCQLSIDITSTKINILNLFTLETYDSLFLFDDINDTGSVITQYSTLYDWYSSIELSIISYLYKKYNSELKSIIKLDTSSLFSNEILKFIFEYKRKYYE